MIIRLADTTATAIASRLVKLRDEGGAVALGRVLTLVVVTRGDPEPAITAANTASREHPCRVIVIASGSGDVLDAEIRVGGDAGASEVIVLRLPDSATEELDSLVMPLLLPDAPIVTWWVHRAPASPARDPLGAMAQRRLTDVLQCEEPVQALRDLANGHSPGDTDLSWARITLWRGLLAAALDEPPYEPVREAVVLGNLDHPSTSLLAAWLAHGLRCPVRLEAVDGATAITGVRLARESGELGFERKEGSTVLTLARTGVPRQRVSLPLRPLADCLIEELRRLDPDEVYGTTLLKGLGKVESP